MVGSKKSLFPTFADLPATDLLWEKMPPAPVTRLDGASVVIGDLFYVFARYGSLDYAAYLDQQAIKKDAQTSCMLMGALLLNIAIGGLIDYESVAHQLESGHLGGLGTDVAWTEPFNPDDPLLKHKNVIITPHVEGVTEYSYRSMAKVVGDVALQLHAGLWLTGKEIVNSSDA